MYFKKKDKRWEQKSKSRTWQYYSWRILEFIFINLQTSLYHASVFDGIKIKREILIKIVFCSILYNNLKTPLYNSSRN